MSSSDDIIDALKQVLIMHEEWASHIGEVLDEITAGSKSDGCDHKEEHDSKEGGQDSIEQVACVLRDLEAACWSNLDDAAMAATPELLSTVADGMSSYKSVKRAILAQTSRLKGKNVVVTSDVLPLRVSHNYLTHEVKAVDMCVVLADGEPIFAAVPVTEYGCNAVVWYNTCTPTILGAHNYAGANGGSREAQWPESVFGVHDMCRCERITYMSEQAVVDAMDVLTHGINCIRSSEEKQTPVALTLEEIEALQEAFVEAAISCSWSDRLPLSPCCECGETVKD